MSIAAAPTCAALVLAVRHIVNIEGTPTPDGLALDRGRLALLPIGDDQRPLRLWRSWEPMLGAGRGDALPAGEHMVMPTASAEPTGRNHATRGLLHRFATMMDDRDAPDA